MENSKGQREDEELEKKHKQNLRIFRYRLYRSRQKLKVCLMDLYWDFTHNINKVKFLAEAAGLVILAVYTFYTMMMYHANKEAADAARSAAETAQRTLTQSIEAFRTDERAWVEVGKIDKVAFPPDPPFGIIFKFSIYPKNVGKTVARNVRIHLDNINTWGSFADDSHAILMFQDQLFNEGDTSKRHITPDKPGPQTIAPGDLSPVPVYSGGQEPRRYGTDFQYNFILGRIDYSDAFNVEHWKHICFFITNPRGDLGHASSGTFVGDGGPQRGGSLRNRRNFRQVESSDLC